MSARDDFDRTLDGIVQLIPSAWHPGRPQSAHDRMFTDPRDVTRNFTRKTPYAAQWLDEAAAFSEIVRKGFETDKELRQLALRAANHIADGTNQFHD